MNDKIRFKFMDSIRTSVSKKVTLILIAVAVLPVLVIGLIFCRNSLKESQMNYVNTSKTVLKNGNKRLDDYIKQLDTLSLLVFYDNESINDNEAWEIYSNVQKRLLYISSQRREIESLLYYFPQQEELYIVNSLGNRSFLHAKGVEDMEWYRHVFAVDKGYVIEPQHIQVGYEEQYGINEKTPIFSLNRKFSSGIGEKSVLSINCKLTYIQDICKDAITYSNEVMEYLNKDGEMIFSSDTYVTGERKNIYKKIMKDSGKEGSFHYQDQESGESYTVVYTKSEINGNILYKSIPNRVLNKYLVKSIQMTMVVLGVVILFMIPLGVLLSKRVTRPLFRLQKHMKLVGQGDTSVRVPVESTDEIGQISATFNRMEDEIEQLINETFRLELAKKTAQLESLMAQINPHFINNILQSIGGAALEKGIPEIYRACGTLAKMLRYSIKGRDKVPMSQEIENIKDYMFIQKFRYEEKLEYLIETDPILCNFLLPKLTLQPLVENAIIHGLEEKKTVGTVTVRGQYREEKMIIEVIDDGVGMEAATLENLCQRLKKSEIWLESDKKSIGLINVYQRLYLEYEDRFRMKIDSVKGEGTTVCIEIDITDGEQIQEVNHVPGSDRR